LTLLTALLPRTYSQALALTPTLTLLPTTPTAVTPDSSVLLSAPASDQALFGTVRIVGTANNAQMLMYRLEFLPGADPQGKWQVIASQVTQQVTNGTLGQWDTTKVADGTYQIRLRVTLRNNTVIDVYARGLQVSNQQPTPLPTVPPPPTATNLPTLGPSPTALIQQPPTATIAVIAPSTAVIIASPTTVPLITDSGSNTNISQPVSLSLGAIQSALCSGGLLALIAFALGGAYMFVRGRLQR
jgi:hypothetical protein